VRLRNVLAQAVHLAVLDGDSIIVIASQDTEREPRATSRVGVRLPVHATAAGKVIVAHMESLAQQALLDRLPLQPFTGHTLTRREALKSELDLTRARGYAVEYLEHEDGVVSVAAPILDIEGRPIGAVCVSGRAEQLDPVHLHGLSSPVIGSARTISHNAGGQFMSIQPRAEPTDGADVEVQCVAETRSLLGEGPTWSPRDGALYWVDILTPSVHCFDSVHRTDREVKLGSMVSVAIPKATGGLLVATPTGLMTLDLESKTLSAFCHPESDRPGNRYNDGKCDRMGRLWIGTLDMGTAANRGNLFRVDADGGWKKMDSGITVSNGLGWSPDNRRMYFTDSVRRTIYVYDFDLYPGTISNRRPFIMLDATDGTPDGLTVDEEGCLWVAVWDAWRVSRYRPTGAS
jgi:sugar lactone lactonase YvrE